MAKKTIKKSKKTPAKKPAKKFAEKIILTPAKATSIKTQFNQQKFNLVLRSLFLSIILFVVCLLLYSITSNPFWNNFFFLFMIVLGFVSIALLIVFLIFAFYRILKR